MTDNFTVRQAILERLGSPEPELPGVICICSGGPSWELHQMFDQMYMEDVHDRDVLERALAKLEQVREIDYQAFYVGRSELLAMYPVHHEVPSGRA